MEGHWTPLQGKQILCVATPFFIDFFGHHRFLEAVCARMQATPTACTSPAWRSGTAARTRWSSRTRTTWTPCCPRLSSRRSRRARAPPAGFPPT